MHFYSINFIYLINIFLFSLLFIILLCWNFNFQSSLFNWLFQLQILEYIRMFSLNTSSNYAQSKIIKNLFNSGLFNRILRNIHISLALFKSTKDLSNRNFSFNSISKESLKMFNKEEITEFLLNKSHNFRPIFLNKYKIDQIVQIHACIRFKLLEKCRSISIFRNKRQQLIRA